MSNKITVANRKMYKTLEEVVFFCDRLKNELEALSNTNAVGTIIIAPALVYLDVCVAFFEDMPQVHIAAQTCSSHQQGAYTGEVSATMLASLGVDRVIVGHSERRAYFAESGNTVTQKIQQAHNASLGIIYCCGEPEKNNDQSCYITQEITTELLPVLAQLDEDKLLIAYEPRWAIGTGKIPDQQHIELAFELIGNTHEKMSDVKFLYGGSVTPDNSYELYTYMGIDGFLIGGASLEVESFLEISS